MKPRPRFPAKHFLPLAAGALVALLCGCAATSLKQTWKSPDCRQPVGKLAIIVMEDRPMARPGFEQRLVAVFSTNGQPAETTYDLLSLAEIKQNKRAAAERLTASGAQAVLILRLAGRNSAYREVRAGRELWAPTIAGFETMGWYDYYNVAFTDMGTTYGSLRENVYVEAALYDLKTEKRLWSGLTETTVRENMDGLAEVEALAAKIAAAMRKDDVIQ